jgi:hypothetical protein
LEHAGARIGLPIEKRQWLGQVLKDRVAEQAMADASVKLLEPLQSHETNHDRGHGSIGRHASR